MFSFFSKSPSTSVSVTEANTLSQEKGSVLIDVRESGEYAGGHAKGAVSLPLSTFNDSMAKKLEGYTSVYVICQSGGRSARATDFLQAAGVNAVNVRGGTLAWHAAKLPMA